MSEGDDRDQHPSAYQGLPGEPYRDRARRARHQPGRRTGRAGRRSRPERRRQTTTLRMLTTLIAPTSGTATVAGYDVTTQPSQVRRRIGYVGQGNGAGHAQRVGDELVGQGVIYGLVRRAAKRRTAELLDALELTGLVRRKVSELSGGRRRRLDV